MLTAILEILMS